MQKDPQEKLRAFPLGVLYGCFILLGVMVGCNLKPESRPTCVGCTFATDKVPGEFTKDPTEIVGDVYVEPELGTRLRVRKIERNGHYIADIYAYPSNEDINGIH